MTTTAIPKTPSVWEDFIDIFVSPAQVFARRKGRGFWMALFVYAIIIGALAFGTKSLMQPVYDVALDQASAQVARQNPQITGEQLSQMRKMQEKFAVPVFVVFAPLLLLVTGLVLWIVGKLFDSELNVGDAMMVSTYSFFPKILAMVAGAVIALLVDPSSITSQFSVTVGPGRFVDMATHPVLAAIVGRLDIFTIWVTILLAVGLHVAGKVPKGKAAIAAIIVWVLGALPGLYGAMKMIG